MPIINSGAPGFCQCQRESVLEKLLDASHKLLLVHVRWRPLQCTTLLGRERNVDQTNSLGLTLLLLSCILARESAAILSVTSL